MEGFLNPLDYSVAGIWSAERSSWRQFNGCYVSDSSRRVKVDAADTAKMLQINESCCWLGLYNNEPMCFQVFSISCWLMPMSEAATRLPCFPHLLLRLLKKKATCSQSLSDCITTESRLTVNRTAKERNKKKKKASHWSSTKWTCEISVVKSVWPVGIKMVRSRRRKQRDKTQMSVCSEVEAMTTCKPGIWRNLTISGVVCLYLQNLTSRSHPVFFSYFFFFSKDTWIKCSIMRAVCSVSTY